MPAQQAAPAWANELALAYESGAHGQFILYGNVPNILFTPWEPVEAGAATHLAAAETTVVLDYVDLPPAAEAD